MLGVLEEKRAVASKSEIEQSKKEKEQKAKREERPDYKKVAAPKLTGIDKLKKYQSDQRTKQAPINLALQGAARDVHGVVHVGAKGTKKFFQ